MRRPGALDGKIALVTGASGFIGSAMSSALRHQGAEVHGTSRVARRGGECDRWWTSDLTDLNDVRSIVRASRPDLVCHFASHVSAARDLTIVPAIHAANLTSAVNLLAAVSELTSSRILLTGSFEEPDHGPGLPVPSSPYAAAKFAASAYGRMFHALFGTRVAILRVFMVYGPGQKDHGKLIPYVTLSLLRGRVPEVSSGRRPVDWVHVDDVVNAYLAAATADNISGQTLDVGTGVLTSVGDVVQRLTDIIDPSLTPRFGAVADRPHEQVRAADVAPTAQAIGWRPEVTLDRGLRQTVDWFRQQLRASG